MKEGQRQSRIVRKKKRDKTKWHEKHVKGGKQAVEMEEQLEGSCKKAVRLSGLPKDIMDR